MNTLIGRIKEQAILQETLNSTQSEMVAVIGRRRVGKTFLIQTVYAQHICFEISGIQNAPRKEQLQNFAYQLGVFANSGLPIKEPKNWLEAFILLITYLKQQTYDFKPVLFFDELPWLATHKSGFLRGLSFFWNSWAVRQNVVVVICGSAASWMIQKVVNHKGGLHNRITQHIFLKPFNLFETESYLQYKNVSLNRYQIIQLYMALGGIPFYLNLVKAGKSVIQIIDELCFSELGQLNKEFLRLYPALFDHADNHIKIIRALAQKRQGLSRKAIALQTKLSNGGGLSKILAELQESGFIKSYYQYGKKNTHQLYRLIDEYSLFYLKFIEKEKNEGEGTWEKISQQQSYKTWSGYAFENICLKHISQIKKALGISRIAAQSRVFAKQGTAEQKGIQIDLLIDRKDFVINLCEAKFYNADFILTKAYAAELRNKMAIFQKATQTKKQLFWTLITTFGLHKNQHSQGLIQQVITLNDLFEA